MNSRSCLLSLLVLLETLLPAGAEADATPPLPFKEGDFIRFEDQMKLKEFVPPEFWANRDFFFYEGMRLQIGPSHRDYSPAEAYQQATAEFAAQVRLGPENSLENYRAGQPFPMDQIDCRSDPQAGAKIAWNFVRRWDGAGGAVRFYYSYWDRGEKLPLFYEGHSQSVSLAFRPEPQFAEAGGDVFRGERRYTAGGPEVEAPFDARGIMLLTYRYKASYAPKSRSRNDDTWVYLPSLRRVRRISTAQRTDAVSGTDFTLDDLFSFNGIVPQYEWICLGESEILAPMNSRVRAYPYEEAHDFGPYGLSYADDRWELRRAVAIRFVPTNADHPYHHKDIYIDKQTLEPLFSFAYDRKNELWKILWHNHRWSDEPGYDEYHGWQGVDSPRDLTVVSDTIVNVQTGTGNRIEFWDRNGMPMKTRGQIRRFIDVGRLTKGR